MRLLRSDVESRATSRGYALDEIAGCFIRVIEGDLWEVDVEHPEYPRTAKGGSQLIVPRLPVCGGPGTELKGLLALAGITASPGCTCNARASLMDEREAAEPGWCDAHLDEIVGWLSEEAASRGLPFIDAAGRLLVRRAIANARRNA
jgi:hypothetical protein